jgi:hypothetical protein
MGIFLFILSQIGSMLMAIIILLKIIVALLAANMILKLYDRFKIREKLVKAKGGLKRVLKNMDQRIVNFFDNRK